MRGALGATAPLALALALVAGCGDDPITQVIVTIDADPEVKSQARVIDVSIYGGVRAAGALPGEGPQQVPFSVVASDAWPVQVALAPRDGDTSRLYRVIATARNGRDETLAEVRAISGYVEGQTLWLRLYFDRECLGVDPCEQPDETCAMGDCVDARRDEKDLPPYDEDDVTDAGVDTDGGVECIASAECDDEISCTLDACSDGVCVFSPVDDDCTDGPDGWCDPTGGCQYSRCDATTCVADPCQTAECDADGRCVRTSLCSADQMCCAGTCVPDGCDDGEPCTDDSCGASGCENVANAEICDDGTYCNGVDACADGTCSVHPGDPCPGASMCDESMDACTGCAGDGDCPDDTVTGAGSCTYSSTCAQAGTRPVTVTSYSCADSVCVESSRSDTQPCSRSTGGNTCGTPDVVFGLCVPTSTCSTTGTRERRETPRVCSGGTCSDGTTSTTTASCTATPPASCSDAGVGDGCASTVEVNCGDSVDDDCDTLVDCDDPDCDTECMVDDGGLDGCFSAVEVDCFDGMDDDCDTLVDCDDPDCDAECILDAGVFDGCPETVEVVCDDFVDDDCDSFTDCEDSDCAGMPACMEGGVAGFDGGV